MTLSIGFYREFFSSEASPCLVGPCLVGPRLVGPRLVQGRGRRRAVLRVLRAEVAPAQLAAQVVGAALADQLTGPEHVAAGADGEGELDVLLDDQHGRAQLVAHPAQG